MSDTLVIHCENTGTQLRVAPGTPLTEIARDLGPGRYPWLAALVDNRLVSLHRKLYRAASVRLVDATSFAGMRVLQGTACFLLQAACRELWPGSTLRIRHSMGRSGFYCEIDGIDGFTPEQTAAIEGRMHEIAARDLPLIPQRIPTGELRARYAACGFDDKVALLDTRPRLYSELTELAGIPGYFYTPLAPSTGYAARAGVEPYDRGFYLALPLRSDPDRLCKKVRQDKMFGIFREYRSWVELMGIPTVAEVNRQVLDGNARGLVLLAEAFHERNYARTADAIAEAHRVQGVRIVLISGPSSSGKTTSAKRLAIQLGLLGLRPVPLSLDDYFVDRDKTPLDADGNYDFEALEAIDLDLFNDHLRRLMRGEEVEIPRYDFVTGRRTRHDAPPLRLDARSVLIVEGIHALNPRLTPAIPDEAKFRIYVSCFTSVAMDYLSRIPTADNRLLRRLTRDYAQRGADALKTLRQWPSVRRGEERHIFPYQEEADAMINSALPYEISVLRPFAERVLREVPDTVPEYEEARRLLRFLDNFVPFAPETLVPPTSVLREFIGGSLFRY